MITKSVTGKEKEIGEAWDGLDVPGKKALTDGGLEAHRLVPAEDAKFRKAGVDLNETKIKELDGKGLPASAVYKSMKDLAEKHSKSSKNFWN